MIELKFEQDKIRNFSIIAHIDHGKSTLADRILELTKSVAVRDMEAQILDDMELERERGITIKARAVTTMYKADDGNEYLLNLIDTPGHVDFNYEVSRSLAACEGAVLVVDASQGIEAQTLANTYLAVDSGLEIVPVVNKIDLVSADPDRVINEIEDVIGIPAEDAPRISAKQGLNIHDVLEKIVTDIPAPTGDINAPLRGLIFDSYYDSYKGVIIYVRLMEGQIHPGDDFKLMATGSSFSVVECGLMHATSLEQTDALYAGEVGYIAASIKSLSDAQVGDTITLVNNPADEPLPGYREAQSILPELDFYLGEEASCMVINPRNSVLPIIKQPVLKRRDIDSFILYDKRHHLLLERDGAARRFAVIEVDLDFDVHAEVILDLIQMVFQLSQTLFTEGHDGDSGEMQGRLDVLKS